jgi:CRISPR-associated protein Cmr6
MRNEITKLASRRSLGHHPGLLLQRYLIGEGGDPSQRRELLSAATQAAGSPILHTIYVDAFNRWTDSFPENSLHSAETLKAEGRLIVGLGSENVLECGLRLHHTYGTPIIPGSALKGLTAHYCRDVWGQRRSRAISDENQPYLRGGQFHDLVFGTTDDGGMITFHDAWLIPECLSQGAIQLDVMTPHHKKWQFNEAPPTDFDSPVPVSFLSVTGIFQIRLSWNGPIDTPPELATEWTGRTMTLMKEALAEWGIGGKTSSGYGRLVVPEDKTKSVDQVPGALVDSAPPGPVHKPHTRVLVVQRTIDGKIRYKAVDGRLGSLIKGTPPSLSDGESTQLWIVRVDEKNKKVPYVFQVDEPQKPKPQQQTKNKR